MSVSKIEQELVGASGIKPSRKEARQAFLERLMKAVAKLKDPEWEALTTEAQEWNNNAAQAFKEEQNIADFSDISDEAASPSKAKAPKPTGLAQADETDGDDSTNVEEVAPVVKTGRRVSACHTIKTFVAKKPNITVAEIAEKLKDTGLKVSDVTIATLRSDLRDTFRVLNELKITNVQL